MSDKLRLILILCCFKRLAHVLKKVGNTGLERRDIAIIFICWALMSCHYSRHFLENVCPFVLVCMLLCKAEKFHNDLNLRMGSEAPAR